MLVNAPNQDLTSELVERVRAATAGRHPLRIVGGDSKYFYGRPVRAETLGVSGHAGVLSYDPAELVITARAGTRLMELEALLRSHGQRLAFEPPAFRASATLGGTVAAGLAGPARAARGPASDYVLGARLLTGDGRVLRFGGEVMKNVAGYDVSRLLAGSLGILGVMLDVSLKVLPLPLASRTLRIRIEAAAALSLLASASQRGVPITASFWCADELHVRLEGSPLALDEIAPSLGGDRLDDTIAATWWQDVREHRHAVFADGTLDLWRVQLPALASWSATVGRDRCNAFEWNGAQRWHAGADPEFVQRTARAGGGHATLFRPGTRTDLSLEVFEPLSPALFELHRSVKRVFDPAGVLNPGRMYADL